MTKETFLHSLKFGVFICICCLAFFAVNYNLKPNPLSRRGDIGFNIILIWAAVWYYKRNNGGILHFYQAMSIGFVVNISAAIFTGIGLYLFLEYIDIKPFQTWMLESKAKVMQDKAFFENILNKENIDRQIASFDHGKPYQIILDELGFKQLAIIPMSLISMALRKIKN